MTFGQAQHGHYSQNALLNPVPPNPNSQRPTGPLSSAVFLRSLGSLNCVRAPNVSLPNTASPLSNYHQMPNSVGVLVAGRLFACLPYRKSQKVDTTKCKFGWVRHCRRQKEKSRSYKSLNHSQITECTAVFLYLSPRYGYLSINWQMQISGEWWCGDRRTSAIHPLIAVPSSFAQLINWIIKMLF